MSGDLLCKLLTRGHNVSLEGGRLVITPGGDRAVPRAWFEENKAVLATEVISLFEASALRYVDFSVGNFNAGRAAGVRVVFEHCLSGAPARVFFNAGITRTRSTATGEKGARLPGRQFRPKRGSKFIQFWLRTGLAEPRYLSEYHEYMGRLKPLIMTGACDGDGKLTKDTLRPLSITADQIRSAALEGGVRSRSLRVYDGMSSVNHREQVSGSEPSRAKCLQGMQGDAPTAPGSAKKVVSVTVGEVLTFPNTSSLMSQPVAASQILSNVDQLPATNLKEQTHDDWWASYYSAGTRKSRLNDHE